MGRRVGRGEAGRAVEEAGRAVGEVGRAVGGRGAGRWAGRGRVALLLVAVLGGAAGCAPLVPAGTQRPLAARRAHAEHEGDHEVWSLTWRVTPGAAGAARALPGEAYILHREGRVQRAPWTPAARTPLADRFLGFVAALGPGFFAEHVHGAPRDDGARFELQVDWACGGTDVVVQHGASGAPELVALRLALSTLLPCEDPPPGGGSPTVAGAPRGVGSGEPRLVWLSASTTWRAPARVAERPILYQRGEGLRVAGRWVAPWTADAEAVFRYAESLGRVFLSLDHSAPTIPHGTPFTLGSLWSDTQQRTSRMYAGDAPDSFWILRLALLALIPCELR